MAQPVPGSVYYTKLRWYGAYGQTRNFISPVYAWWRKLR